MSARLSELLVSIPATLQSSVPGLRASVRDAALDLNGLAAVVGLTPAAVLFVPHIEHLGSSDGWPELRLQLALYLVVLERSSAPARASAALDLAEQVLALIPGQQWGEPAAWYEPSESPVADLLTSVEDADTPTATTVWLLQWSQDVRLAAAVAEGSVDPNLLLLF